MRLSIIVPVFNEINTIEIIINKILNAKLNIQEIIIVDDFSTDGTRDKLDLFKDNKIIKILYHESNLGKGACIKTATQYLTGDYVVIQDADLEYDPKDIHKLVETSETNYNTAIYGSRVLGRKKIIFNFFILFRIFANNLLTILSNTINSQKLTDAHTCYKFIPSDIFKKLNLKHNDFSICPEITIKLSKLNIKIIEVPISYVGRSYAEGKKIKFKDAVIAFYTLLKFRFFL